MYHPDQQTTAYICPRHGISDCDECPQRDEKPVLKAEPSAVCGTHQQWYKKATGCLKCAAGEPKVEPFNPLDFMFGSVEVTYAPWHEEEIRKENIKRAIRILVDSGYEVSHPVSLDPDRQGGRTPGSPRFIELLKSMKDTHIAKNAGYAGADNPDFFANFRDCEGINIPAFMGCLVRMGDKWSRIKSLAKNPANDRVGEAITDTLIDLANYALIAICLYEQQQAAAIEEEVAEFKGILHGLSSLGGRK